MTHTYTCGIVVLCVSGRGYFSDFTVRHSHKHSSGWTIWHKKTGFWWGDTTSEAIWRITAIFSCRGAVVGVGGSQTLTGLDKPSCLGAERKAWWHDLISHMLQGNIGENTLLPAAVQYAVITFFPRAGGLLMPRHACRTAPTAACPQNGTYVIRTSGSKGPFSTVTVSCNARHSGPSAGPLHIHTHPMNMRIQWFLPVDPVDHISIYSDFVNLCLHAHPMFLTVLGRNLLSHSQLQGIKPL